MRAIASFVLGLVTISYPLAVHYGLTYRKLRLGAFLLFASLLLNTALSGSQYRRGGDTAAELTRTRWLNWITLFGIGALACVSLLVDDQRYLLAAPVLINAGLFSLFFSSLSGPTPLIERLARLQVSDLSPSEVSYCRTVTGAWCVFFAVNGATSALLACTAPLFWWTLYTGLLAYLLMAAFGITELTLRKYRFRRYGPGLLDRLYRVLFPPRSGT